MGPSPTPHLTVASCFKYSVYSTTVCSDVRLPLEDLVADSGSNEIFLSRTERENPPATSYWMEIINSQGRRVHLRSRDAFDSPSASNLWLLSVENVATFWWRSGQRRIEYLASESISLGYWLLHLVIPLFKRLEEQVLMMHSAGVEIQHKGVLISAASFGGKSTLAHALLNDGHKFMADDKLGLFVENGTLMCTSSYPYCRDYRATEDLGNPVTEHQPASMEVGGIYILTRGAPEATIKIQSLKGYEAFSLLQVNRDIPLSFLRQREFRRLSSITRLARVFRLEMPWSLERSKEVAGAIADHQTSLKRHVGPRNGHQTD